MMLYSHRKAYERMSRPRRALHLVLWRAYQHVWDIPLFRRLWQVYRKTWPR